MENKHNNHDVDRGQTQQQWRQPWTIRTITITWKPQWNENNTGNHRSWKPNQNVDNPEHHNNLENHNEMGTTHETTGYKTKSECGQPRTITTIWKTTNDMWTTQNTTKTLKNQIERETTQKITTMMKLTDLRFNRSSLSTTKTHRRGVKTRQTIDSHRPVDGRKCGHKH